MCSCLLRNWVRLFNALVFLVGLLLIGVSIYVFVHNGGTRFAWAFAAISIYVFALSLLGLKSVSGRSALLVGLYTMCLVALLIFEATLIIAYIFYKDKTVSYLDSLNNQDDSSDNSSGQQTESFISEHAGPLQAALCIFAVLQIFTLTVTFFCPKSVAQRTLEDDESMDSSLLSSNGDYVGRSRSRKAGSSSSYSTEHPKTDAQRARLNDKYGGGFEKKVQLGAPA